MATKRKMRKKLKKPKRAKAFRERKHRLKTNGLLLINKMVELNKDSSDASNAVLVDEILHSIFFLGEIHELQFQPDEIVTHVEILKELKQDYPGPFELYKSQLPRRSPFSCVLEMVVRLKGQENEKDIIEELQEIIRPLRKGDKKLLLSSTICVSQKEKAHQSGSSSDQKIPVRYYGVSMSTCDDDPRLIMIAASCLAYWHSSVAGAVMTYYPKKVKKEYFDGTIKLPKHVRCEAFDLRSRKQKAPCKLCRDLFGLETIEKCDCGNCAEAESVSNLPKNEAKVSEQTEPTSETCTKTKRDEGWPYGNCAEAESLSNLLKNETKVSEETGPTSEKCTENRQRAEEDVSTELKNVLKMLKFTWKPPDKFYTQ